MTFYINGMKWIIKEISNEEMQYTYSRRGYYSNGITMFSENKIFINKETPEIARTLKHELTHCWLHAYGHCQDEKQFTNEDVCEIVASINDFIDEIVEKYMKWRKKNVKNKRRSKND